MGMKPVYKVLVVDDEESILELLKYNLEKEGYAVKVASNGLAGIDLARKFKPDVVLLDVMMPHMDGVEACRKLRGMADLANTYIVFLTARSEEYTEVKAFDAGADDYITKPIKPQALMSRLQSLLRRDSKGKFTSDMISVGGIVIDRASYTVRLDEKKISLPKKEFELLYFLAQYPNKVFTRDELLQHIWGTEVYVLARTVDVHVRKVREKIGDDYIATVKGVGYKFNQN